MIATFSFPPWLGMSNKFLFIYLLSLEKISSQIKSLGRLLRVQVHFHINSPMRFGLCLEMSLGTSSGGTIFM